MRITAETPERLTLEERPWLLGIILTAVILFFLMFAVLTVGQNLWLGLGMGLGAAMFGLAFIAFVRRVIVIFDRAAGAVVIRSASLLGQKEQTLALADLKGAIVETTISRSTGSSSSKHGRTTSTTHRPSLQTGQGVVRLSEVYAGGNGAAVAVAAINQWLAGNPPAA